MWRVLRVTAIVFMAVAMLNATAGVCLCRDKDHDSPAGQAGSRSCCHRSALVVSGTGTSCCQIENAPHTATSPDVVVVAQPAFASTPVVALDIRVDAPSVMALAYSPSPPGRILRV
jgi:hypothetical protein